MRVLVQRVSHAAVRVEGRPVAEIGVGLLVLVGFSPADTEESLEWMAAKLRRLRIFADGEGKMNLSVQDVRGEMLVVSQFTLYGDATRGLRPSFVAAARPQQAERLYKKFLDACRKGGVPVGSGEFGARMDVDLVNDGPVTLWLER